MRSVLADLFSVSRLFGNTLYLVALGYYTVITFLGYSGKSSRISSHCMIYNACSTSISTSYRTPPFPTCSIWHFLVC